MAFSSQSFKAPKINKGNFSSPVSSGVSKISASTSAPKLKSIYGVASKKNLSYSMTQDSCEPYSTEKTC